MSEYILEKGTVFTINNYRLFAITDLILDSEKKHQLYFILDNWDLCDFPDIEATPVVVVKCETKYDLYSLYEDNIIYGTFNDFLNSNPVSILKQ